MGQLKGVRKLAPFFVRVGFVQELKGDVLETTSTLEFPFIQIRSPPLAFFVQPSSRVIQSILLYSTIGTSYLILICKEFS